MAKTKTTSDADPFAPAATSEPQASLQLEKNQSVSDQEKESSPEKVETSIAEENNTEDSGGRSVTFWIILAISGSIGLCLILFLVAVIVGTASGQWENVASMVAIVRDLLIILLVMQGILVGIALIFMILQLSILFNILQNEVKPILESAQQTASTVKGTASFMGKYAVSPIIRLQVILAGISAFLQAISDFRAMTTTSKENVEDDNDEFEVSSSFE